MNQNLDSVKTLVVSDDQGCIDRIAAEFRAAGYEMLVARNAEECFQALQNALPDLVVLDSTLPLISGFFVANAIRQDSNVPLIMLASCVEEAECVRSLEIGAEDCVAKPIRPREFMMRVRNVLARHGKGTLQDGERLASAYLPSVYEGDFVIDPNRHQIKVRGENVRISPLQFKCLLFLANHPNRVFSHIALLEKVWGESGPHPESRKDAVTVLIREIRKKIEADPAHPQHLLTSRGVGYLFRF